MSTQVSRKHYTIKVHSRNRDFKHEKGMYRIKQHVMDITKRHGRAECVSFRISRIQLIIGIHVDSGTSVKGIIGIIYER